MPVEVQIVSIVMGSLAFTGTVWALAWFMFKKKELETRGSEPELVPVVDALRDEVEQLADMQEHTRSQLTEMQERLDFTERLLTAGRTSQEDRNG
ncbi:MAG: hypothetical protein HKM89_07225 [Gemmatimonadales bacterium]|nr:hypothetical protein [Gemmatimonadales bacterium]